MLFSLCLERDCLRGQTGAVVGRGAEGGGWCVCARRWGVTRQGEVGEKDSNIVNAFLDNGQMFRNTMPP